MNTYKNISYELKEYFSNHSIFRILLPLDVVILFGSIGLMTLQQFVSIGGFLSSIAYYAFLLGLLLAYTNLNEKMLYTGFFGYAALEAITFLRYSVFSKYRFMNYSSLIAILIFGGLGYLIFKRSLSVQSSNSGSSTKI